MTLKPSQKLSPFRKISSCRWSSFSEAQLTHCAWLHYSSTPHISPGPLIWRHASSYLLTHPGSPSFCAQLKLDPWLGQHWHNSFHHANFIQTRVVTCAILEVTLLSTHTYCTLFSTLFSYYTLAYTKWPSLAKIEYTIRHYRFESSCPSQVWTLLASFRQNEPSMRWRNGGTLTSAGGC